MAQVRVYGVVDVPVHLCFAGARDFLRFLLLRRSRRMSKRAAIEAALNNNLSGEYIADLQITGVWSEYQITVLGLLKKVVPETYWTQDGARMASFMELEHPIDLFSRAVVEAELLSRISPDRRMIMFLPSYRTEGWRVLDLSQIMHAELGAIIGYIP